LELLKEDFRKKNLYETNRQSTNFQIDSFIDANYPKFLKSKYDEKNKTKRENDKIERKESDMKIFTD